MDLESSSVYNTQQLFIEFLITGASGAVPRQDWRRMELHAKLYYESVRKRTGDVERIAKNSGFSVDDMKKIKEHMFLNKYDLGGSELSRFDPDYDQSQSWQRLTEGKNIQEMDIILLHHELFEYRLMHEHHLTYEEAHKIADEKYSYSKYVKELNLKEGVE